MAPTYSIDRVGNFQGKTQVDESEIIHRDYFPVITSIKHIPRRGPQIHAPNDILEIRRAIIFRNLWNIYPYPEEVIRIDRSKLRRKEHDVIFESFVDLGYKKDITRLYSVGYLLRRQMLNNESHKAFELNSGAMLMFNDLFIYKGLKECSYLSKALEISY